MPLTAIGWTTDEDIKLAELVEPNRHIYNVEDPSRKNIIARDSTWQEIARAIHKPVEECKKRWRGLRDGYMRSIKNGSMHISKKPIIDKLQFLGGPLPSIDIKTAILDMDQTEDSQEGEQVITDGQEYYEITVVDSPQQEDNKQTIKMVSCEPKRVIIQPPGRVVKRNGRKRNIPILRSSEPIKILPKPIAVKPNILRYVENTKEPEQKSQVLDSLIERVLRENTNEIDVFFRSMAASVKKLHPSLIPKVKMEVCNVIAKYEMQSFNKK